MGAGEYDRRITLQQKTISHDSYNEPVEIWWDARTVWAGVAEIGSRELYQAQKLYAETSAVFKIRYTERINARMRIKYGHRLFEILGEPIPDAKRTQLTISAKAVE